MRVLISGAAGRLGRKLTRELEASHDLLLGDVSPVDDPRFMPLDVRDMESARAAARRCDGIVHLAIVDWPVYTAEEALRYAEANFQVHVVGTHHMLQAACEAGVRRFIYTSSVSAVDGLPRDAWVGSDCRHFSNGVYGLTKGFGEDLCRLFHHNAGLPVAVLRLGNLYVPEPGGVWLGNVYVPEASGPPIHRPSPSRVHVDDVTRAIALALETPEPGYALVHVVGDNPGRQWDLEAARSLYGWEPRYSFGEDGLPRAAATAPSAPASSSSEAPNPGKES